MIFEVVSADATVQQKLSLMTADEQVYHIKRVRSKEIKPFVIEEMWMPIKLILNLKL